MRAGPLRCVAPAARFRLLPLLAAGFVVAAAPVGCGGTGALSPPRDDGGTGGSGQGGTPASGGAFGSGGTTGVGGVPGSGGAPGTGGGASPGGGGATCAGVPAPEGGKICTEIQIGNAASIEAAMDCLEVTGSVVIAPSFVGTVELPRLRKVGLDVRRDGAPNPTNATDPAMTARVRLPNLKEIGHDLWFYLDFNLVELDLRSLETVGGRAWVYRDTLIHTLRLDALTQVGADFYIADVARLPDCVVKDIASHVKAATVMVTGAKTPTNCHCEPVCGHAEQLCP